MSQNNSISELSRDDIRSIFMGKLFVFPGTENEVKAVDQGAKSDIRAEFYKVVAKKSPRKMNSYWARYLFTGKGKPPMSVDGGDEMVVKTVAASDKGIGYIDSSSVDDSVKIVFRLSPGGN